MSFIPSLQSLFDTNNSSTSLLSSGGTFVGNPTNVGLYNTITVTVLSDVNSSPNGLLLQLSNDMITWTTDSYTVLGSYEQIIYLAVTSKFFRIRYTNGGNSQSTFNLQTIISPTLKIPNSITRLSSDVNGNLNVGVKSSLTKLILCDQLDFTYNMDPNKIKISTIGTGQSILSDGSITISAGPTTGSLCTLKCAPNFNSRCGKRGVIQCGALIQSDSSPNSPQYIGIGDETNGYFFGTNSNFVILYRSNSIDLTTPQSSWNGDKMDGSGPSGVTINFQSGNMFQISYPLVGFGNVYFHIMSPLTGEYILVHTIYYLNINNGSPLIRNPNIGFFVTSSNGDNDNNSIIINSMAQYIEESKLSLFNSLYSYNSNKIINTNVSLLNIYNNSVFNGINNTACIKLQSLSIYALNEVVTLNIFLNASIDSPSYSQVNLYSIISTDTFGSNVSGGTLIYSTICLSSNIDLINSNIIMKSGDTLSFIVSTISGNSTTCNMAINWIENTY